MSGRGLVVDELDAATEWAFVAEIDAQALVPTQEEIDLGNLAAMLFAAQPLPPIRVVAVARDPRASGSGWTSSCVFVGAKRRTSTGMGCGGFGCTGSGCFARCGNRCGCRGRYRIIRWVGMTAGHTSRGISPAKSGTGHCTVPVRAYAVV